ncbi:MAG TPA: DciA family protein [Vicinamibacterales bacterium]|nr:DciA family protein [Vicinamibacterales bacterium]
MVPLQNFATGVIAEVIRRQPPSPGRTTFAWTVAVGPALARSATVTLVDQVLYVRTRDARWAAEIERLKSTILPRMQHLLGTGSVLSMEITSA